jgi:hypothetical protein
MLRGLTPRGVQAGCRLAVCIAFALALGSVRANADAGAATAESGSAPRVSVQSPDFELVAVAQDRKLLIYLDQFEDGAPIDGAQIDVDVAGEAVRAVPVGTGTYLVTADWVATPGHHDIRFTTSIKQGSVTLAGGLDIPLATGDAGNSDTTSSSSPLTIRLPIDILLIIALGILWAFGFSVLAIFRIAKARATPATAQPRLHTVVTDKEPPGRRAA